jgi:hypothetical protein
VRAPSIMRRWSCASSKCRRRSPQRQRPGLRPCVFRVARGNGRLFPRHARSRATEISAMNRRGKSLQYVSVCTHWKFVLPKEASPPITGLAEGARNIDGAVEEQASTARQIAEGMYDLMSSLALAIFAVSIPRRVEAGLQAALCQSATKARPVSGLFVKT